MRDLEIDKQIAKIIYGNAVVFNDTDFSSPLIASSDIEFKKDYLGYEGRGSNEPDVFCIELPQYSNKISEAFWLVEKLHKMECFVSLLYENDGGIWYCLINDSIEDSPPTVSFQVGASSAPLVICKAFLKYYEDKQ